MIGIDGHRPSPFERRQLALQNIITSIAKLSMPERSDVKLDCGQVAGRAADLLKRDTEAGSLATLINDSILSASGTLFLSYLQDLPPVENSLQTSRFENGLLRRPTITAQRLGCLTVDSTIAYVSRVCQLVLAGTLAERRLTGVLKLNPSLSLLGGLDHRTDQHDLLVFALRECQKYFGTIMLAPSGDGQSLEILNWTEDPASRARPERFTPENQVSIECKRLIDHVAFNREFKLGGNGAAVKLQLAVGLEGVTPMSCAGFMDLVLPIESQVALAYEGLYFRYTRELRTPHLGLKFAAESEGVDIAAWSRLVNFLIGRSKQTFLFD